MTRKGTRAARCNWRGRGGFYPSVMYGLSTAGPYFVTAAFVQGRRLIQNDRGRMGTRKASGRRRGHTPRKAGRTRKAQ